MAETLRGGLSLGLSGAGFWSYDIGGFEHAAAALYKRWVAFGLLSSHSRLHGSESYRVPWAFDEEAVDVTREFARAQEPADAVPVGVRRRGAPLGPGDARDVLGVPRRPGTCRYLDRQYMLGPSLLVAPVFDDEGDVELYVPRGRWVGFLDGQVVHGPGWVRQRHDFHFLPLLVRPGSVLALGSRADRPDYDDAVGPAFEVFDLADGDSAVTHLYDERGAERVSLRVARHGTEVAAEVLAGLDQLTQGWRLTWATGPFGGRTGPTAEAASGQERLVLDLATEGGASGLE